MSLVLGTAVNSVSSHRGFNVLSFYICRSLVEEDRAVTPFTKQYCHLVVPSITGSVSEEVLEQSYVTYRYRRYRVNHYNMPTHPALTYFLRRKFFGENILMRHLYMSCFVIVCHTSN